MIRSLRWKVVGITMLFVTAIMLAVFTGIILTAHRSIHQNAEEHLNAALHSPFQDAFRPGQPDNIPPYFVADVYGNGIIRVSGSSYFQLDDNQAISAIVEAAMGKKERFGVLSEYNLHYLRQDEGPFLKIAFTDSSADRQTLISLIRTSLVIGLAAIVVLFWCCYLLSGVITRPVEKAWQEQRRFLSDASHELKTPLTVILSSAELLAESPDVSPPAQPYVDNIRSESRRMRTLVENMLTLARSEDEIHRPQFAQVDMSDLVSDTALLFEPVAFEANRQLAYQIDENISLMGDAEQLRRLLGILLDNAIKYAPAGTSVSLRLRGEDRHAIIEVENGGEPIPPEDLAHLFERFYRVDTSRSDHGSFGLGLAIAQSIARQHGGVIRCRSDQQGTCFIATLPLKRTTHSEKEKESC